MAATKVVEVWVAVDENGGYAVGTDRDDARGEIDDGVGVRLVKVTLTIPLPTPIEVTADLTGDDDAVLVAARAA